MTTRMPFLAFPSPLRDATGQVVGAVNMFVDITERKRNEEMAQRLASIVEWCTITNGMAAG